MSLWDFEQDDVRYRTISAFVKSTKTDGVIVQCGREVLPELGFRNPYSILAGEWGAVLRFQDEDHILKHGMTRAEQVEG